MNKDLHLTDGVDKLSGIGPVSRESLNKAGIVTIGDLLRTFPAKYRDYSAPLPLAQAQEGNAGLFGALIDSVPSGSYVRGGLHVLRFDLVDEDGSTRAQVRIFNQPYLAKSLAKGSFLYVDGTPRMQNGRIMFSAPSILTKRPEQPIAPIYRTISGISRERMRSAVKNALKQTAFEEPFSEAFLQRFSLVDLKTAYQNMHFPSSMADQQEAARRFTFEDGLILTRILDMLNAEKQMESDKVISGLSRIEAFESMLPFAPTTAQRRVMEEIAVDLEGPVYMNRLLQGDVGSGKTAVALFAMYCAACDGYQSVLLAPTEVLARQHAENAVRIFGDSSVALFTGSMSAKIRKEQRRRVESGEASYIVGTHALFFEELPFSRPGLVIADEQQRFGVRQRKSLFSEYGAMHSLIMSATPIPRSLSLVLQGFMDVSVIDELPPGRIPVKTRLVGRQKMKGMYGFIDERARAGEQAYIVCPLIEPSEEIGARSATETFDLLTRAYPDLKIGLLHGKMETEAKNAVMERFQNGSIQVLVSTTVIEVGVDVPAATIMVILDADRFGLSQLHQLRGRVGRGGMESWCFLAVSGKASPRLHVLCETNDGFRIAEADLEERGAGRVLGLQQHGHETNLGPEDIGMIETYRNMLNEMVQFPQLRADFRHICSQAALRSEELIAQVALN